MERALSGAEAAFGPQHPSVTACQSELAELAALKGRHAEASRRFEQVADLICNSRGEDHPDHAEARRVLGLHCQSQGDYSRAETALRKALQVTRRTAGERHPAVAARMQNLAELSRARGDLAEATDYYREALDVLRYLDTPCDALHANLLHGQAVVLLQQGRPKEAEPLLRAALDIDSSSGDEATPGHAGSVLTLGELHAAAGRDQEASALFGKALEAHFQLAASFGCMLQSSTLSSFWNHYWELSERLLTLAVRTPLPALTIRFLFDVVLRVKGLSSRGMVVAELDELSERHPELHQRLQTRFFLGRQTAARVMRGAGAEGLETHRRLLTSWQEKRESLEQELEPQVPALARQRRWLALDAEQVSAALAPEAVLVEYVCYRPRDFTGLCAQKEKPGPAHYAAFAIVAGRPKDVRLIELGEAAPIDRLAQNTHALWGRRQTGESLANRLLTPLASHIQGACPVVVAANGPLERVRFVDLPGGAGVQRQVTSGRELLDLPAAVGANKADGWLHRLWRWLPGRQ
jgi:Tfp pilus assembly protein PilF